MTLDVTFLRSSLILALGVAACDPAPPSSLDGELVDADLDDLDDLDLVEAEADDDEPMDPETIDASTEPSAPEVDAFETEVDPTTIIDGETYDSDRDVLVLNNGGSCTGTLLRNNIVLTARHCVTTNGTINGPLAATNAFTVRQDGPGATLGASRSVIDLAAMNTQDVAMLRLSGVFNIDGQALGQSTQILAGDQSAAVGRNVICQGYGRNTCAGGTGTLRLGLVSVDAENAGMLEYAPINGYDWIQYKGDSGSSCRLGAFIPNNLNKLLGVLSTGACGTIATEVGPELYRGWVVDQMNVWDGGDSIDTFSSMWGLYLVDTPAGMLEGPPSWQRSGGVLTENSNAFTNTTHHEGTRYVTSVQVAADAIVRVTVDSPDNDAAGLILRYRDPTHYYRLSFDEQRHYARIVRRSGNTWTVLAEDTNFAIDWSSSPEISFYASGTVLAAYVDGQLELVTVDSDVDLNYTDGRAGIYTWGLTNATFDDFEIDRF